MKLWRRRSSMDCREVRQLLQQFLDEETPSLSAAEVEAHLEACLRCGMEADLYRDIKASLARMSDPVPDLTMHRLRSFGLQLASGDGADV